MHAKTFPYEKTNEFLRFLILEGADTAFKKVCAALFPSNVATKTNIPIERLANFLDHYTQVLIFLPFLILFSWYIYETVVLFLLLCNLQCCKREKIGMVTCERETITLLQDYFLILTPHIYPCDKYIRFRYNFFYFKKYTSNLYMLN